MKLILDSQNEPVNLHLELTVNAVGKLDKSAEKPLSKRASPSIEVNEDGTIVMHMRGFDDTGLFWAKWYHGAAGTLGPSGANPFCSGGASLVSQGEYNPGTDISTNVGTVPTDEVVRLSIWTLPEGSGSFSGPDEAEITASGSGSGSSSGEGSSSEVA